MDKKIKLGCIGLGARACSIVTSSVIGNSKIELYAVCDINEEKIKLCQESFDVIGYTDFDEMLKDEISQVLETLTEREEKVIRLRFGLEDGKSRTLEEVGQMFGVTRERIRQIEAKALRKLRHPSRSRKLKDYMVE